MYLYSTGHFHKGLLVNSRTKEQPRRSSTTFSFLSWVSEEFLFNHNTAMANPDRRFIFSSTLASDSTLFCTLKHIQNIHSSLRNTFLMLNHFQNVPFSITPSLLTHFLYHLFPRTLQFFKLFLLEGSTSLTMLKSLLKTHLLRGSPEISPVDCVSHWPLPACSQSPGSPTREHRLQLGTTQRGGGRNTSRGSFWAPKI